MTILVKKKGIPICDGIGIGKSWIIEHPLGRPRLKKKIDPEQRSLEAGKIREAIQLVGFVIDNATREVRRHAGEEEAGMFSVLKAILHDPVLIRTIMRFVDTQCYSAYFAVRCAFEELKQQLLTTQEPYIRQRITDVIEIETGLLDALINPLSLVQRNHSATSQHHQKNRVALGKFLTPRLVLEMRGRSINGIVTEVGGKDSHGAILCRTFAIPAVSGIQHIATTRYHDMLIAVNGDKGEIIMSPGGVISSQLLDNHLGRDESEECIAMPRKIAIMANINLVEHAFAALAADVSGIGLYRTELEFLAANRLLSSREQYRCYRNLVMAMMGRPVVFRLLDVRRDKLEPLLRGNHTSLNLEKSGAAFLLENKQLLYDQARAIKKTASLGSIKVLYPMVENADQFLALKSFFESVEGSPEHTHIEHGVMIELPSACEDATELFRHADFGSIGTNDLQQYLFQVSREDISTVTSLSPEKKTLLWNCIGHIIRAAKSYKKPITVCGEMATNADDLKQFVELGIDAVSVDINKVEKLRRMLRYDDNRLDE